MSTSPNLAIPHVVSNQNNKEVTINEAVDALDRALADALDVDLSAGNVALTSAEFRRHLAFRAIGLTEDRDLTVPAIKHLFVVINPSGTPTVHIRRGTSTVAVGPEAAFILYADGTADGLHALGGGGSETSSPYDFGFVKAAAPAAGAVLGKAVLPRAVLLPADFAGAAGHVDTPPDEPFEIEVTVDTVSIGTITVSDAGAVTFATTDNEPKTVAIGAVVRFVAPDPADPSIAGLAVTLLAALGHAAPVHQPARQRGRLTGARAGAAVRRRAERRRLGGLDPQLPGQQHPRPAVHHRRRRPDRLAVRLLPRHRHPELPHEPLCRRQQPPGQPPGGGRGRRPRRTGLARVRARPGPLPGRDQCHRLVDRRPDEQQHRQPGAQRRGGQLGTPPALLHLRQRRPDPFGSSSTYNNTRGLRMKIWANP